MDTDPFEAGIDGYIEFDKVINFLLFITMIYTLKNF